MDAQKRPCPLPRDILMPGNGKTGANERRSKKIQIGILKRTEDKTIADRARGSSKRELWARTVRKEEHQPLVTKDRECESTKEKREKGGDSVRAKGKRM